MQFRTLKLRKNPECPACGTHEIQQLIDEANHLLKTLDEQRSSA